MDKRDGFKFTVCDTDVAIKTISSMQDIIKEYGFATVADLYDLVGVTGKYADNKYGWTDDITFKLHKLEDDCILITLPEPKSNYISYRSYQNDNSNNRRDYGRARTKISYIDYYNSRSPKPDMVNNPPHYQSETGLEVIDVIEAFTFDLKGIEATDTGNAIKYICRWKNKNGIQDLEKAMWYLSHLIDHVRSLNENKEKENK